MKDHTMDELRRIYDENDPNYNKYLYEGGGYSKLSLSDLLDTGSRNLKYKELIRLINERLTLVIKDCVGKDKIDDNYVYKMEIEEYEDDYNYIYMFLKLYKYKKRSFEDFCYFYNKKLKQEIIDKNRKEECRKEEEYKQYLRLKKVYEKDE